LFREILISMLVTYGVIRPPKRFVT
jgi:hypothetical protein